MAVELGTYPLIIPTGTSTSSGTTQGTSQQSSISESSSGPVATPQSELSLLLSRAAEQVGQNIYQWAVSQLAPDQAVTNAALSNYFNVSNTQQGIANTAAGQYYGITSPQIVQQANQAATYNSVPRQQFAAGQAEAAAVQGGLAGIQNAEQQLQAYGIRPDSGAYQELSKASQAAIGAQAAAAGTQAAQNVRDTGINLLNTAVQEGIQLPGISTNAANAATTATSGAQNAQLANTQTGAQAQGAAQPFLQTASNLTPEQIASQSKSASQGSSQESGTSTGQSVTQSVLPNNIYNPGGGATGNPVTGAHGGAIPALAGGGSLKIMHARIPHAPLLHATPGKVLPGVQGYGSKSKGRGGPKQSPQNSPTHQDLGSTNPGNTSPLNTFLKSDSEIRQAYGEDGGGARKQKQPQDSTDSSTSTTDPVASAIPTDTGTTATPPAASIGDAGGGGMAHGGAIPSPTSGGHVNRNLSPSHGKQVDDIPALLNADEFVMPRDVTAYWGKKHLHKMIDQARAATGAPNPPAKPEFAQHRTMGAPRFVSQHLAFGGIPQGIPTTVPGQASAPGAPRGDTNSQMSPAMSQYGQQFGHQDASAPWQ